MSKKKPQPKEASDHQQDFARSVMQSIRDEDVSMHSKWYFMLLGGVSVLSVFVASALAAMGVGLLLRDVEYAERNGYIDLAGNDEIVSAFPWVLLGVTAIAVISTVTLARRLEFAYRFKSHLFYGAVVGCVIALGLVVSVIGVAERLENNRAFKPLQTLRSQTENSLLFGEVILIEDSFIELETPQGEVVAIEINERTRRRPRTFTPEVGQDIVVLGEKTGESSWRAFAIGDTPHHPNAPRVKGMTKDHMPHFKQY